MPLTLRRPGLVPGLTRIERTTPSTAAAGDVGRTRHLCITLNPGQRTLNLSEGDTTNVHKAHLDSTDPPDPPPAVRCAEWQNPASCGVLFLRGKPPPPHRGRSPDWLKFKKLTVRKSGIQARHLFIRARKRRGFRHAGKRAYPVKPLNVEGLDRPIRAHKEQGNHPAGVIVDMQFPCHSTPRPWWGPMPGTRRSFQCAEPAVDSTVGATCQFRSGYFRYAGKRGQSKRLPSFVGCNYAKFWRPAGSTMKSSACNGGARSGAGSRKSLRSSPF